MKKQLIAATVLTLVSGIAAAQSSVTVFGSVDAGVMHVTKANAAGDSNTVFNNGGLSPSTIGFRGTEDIGGGIKAHFNLEAHYTTTNGATGQFGGLFGRQANLGLSNSWGSLTLGRQYYPAVLAFASTDPRGLKEQFSGLMTWALGGSSANTAQSIDVFSSNAISVNTTLGGVNIGALYGVGNVAGNTKAGSQYSLGLTYAGPVMLSAGYQAQNGMTAAANGTANEKMTLGAGYKYGDFTFKANWMKAKIKDAASGAVTKDEDVYGLGVNWAANARNTVTAAVYTGKDSKTSNSRGTSYILSNDYALSKRTTLYALAAYADAQANASAGVLAAQTGIAGQRNAAFQVGINHKF